MLIYVEPESLLPEERIEDEANINLPSDKSRLQARPNKKKDRKISAFVVVLLSEYFKQTK